MGWLEMSPAPSSIIRETLRQELKREPTELEVVERYVEVKVRCEIFNNNLPLENRAPEDPTEYDYVNRNEDGTPRVKR